MRVVPENSPFPRLLVFPFGALVGGGLVLARFGGDLLLRLAHCPWRDVAGIPCPTCGGTLAAVFLVHGQVTAALKANPLVTLGIAAGALWLLYAVAATVIPAWRRSLVLTGTEKRAARIIVILAVVAAWVWELRRFSA